MKKETIKELEMIIEDLNQWANYFEIRDDELAAHKARKAAEVLKKIIIEEQHQ